jgi:hypothetical protein
MSFNFRWIVCFVSSRDDDTLLPVLPSDGHDANRMRQAVIGWRTRSQITSMDTFCLVLEVNNMCDSRFHQLAIDFVEAEESVIFEYLC